MSRVGTSPAGNVIVAAAIKVDVGLSTRRRPSRNSHVSMKELSPEEVSAGVDRVLEEHPELRNEDPILLLQRLLGDNAKPTKQQSLKPSEDEEDDHSGS